MISLYIWQLNPVGVIFAVEWYASACVISKEISATEWVWKAIICEHIFQHTIHGENHCMEYLIFDYLGKKTYKKESL